MYSENLFRTLLVLNINMKIPFCIYSYFFTMNY